MPGFTDSASAAASLRPSREKSSPRPCQIRSGRGVVVAVDGDDAVVVGGRPGTAAEKADAVSKERMLVR